MDFSQEKLRGQTVDPWPDYGRTRSKIRLIVTANAGHDKRKKLDNLLCVAMRWSNPVLTIWKVLQCRLAGELARRERVMNPTKNAANKFAG